MREFIAILRCNDTADYLAFGALLIVFAGACYLSDILRAIGKL